MTIETEGITIVEETEDSISFHFPHERIWECSFCEKPLYIDEDCDCDDSRK